MSGAASLGRCAAFKQISPKQFLTQMRALAIVSLPIGQKVTEVIGGQHGSTG
ncbi:MAG: hypothetical protein ABJ320_19045 [Lentilitoribacter sp.]